MCVSTNWRVFLKVCVHCQTWLASIFHPTLQSWRSFRSQSVDCRACEKWTSASTILQSSLLHLFCWQDFRNSRWMAIPCACLHCKLHSKERRYTTSPFLDLSQALYLNCLQLWNLKLQSSFLAAANCRKDVNVLQAIFNYMNDMLQHLEAEEKVRSRKMGMASMMTVFKKNKIANFRVKDDPDLSIKAWCVPWLIKASQTRHFPKANLFILLGGLSAPISSLCRPKITHPRV